MRLLIATRNQSRLLRYRRILAGLPFELVSLDDIGSALAVDEIGCTPEDNARQKAVAHCCGSGLPTVAVDAALFVDCLAPDHQPGVLVRRVDGKRLTDSELLQWYRDRLAPCGGTSPASWHSAVAVAISPQLVRVRKLLFPIELRLPGCTEQDPGEPLNSLNYIAEAGRYLAQLTTEERAHFFAHSDTEIRSHIADSLAPFHKS